MIYYSNYPERVRCWVGNCKLPPKRTLYCSMDNTFSYVRVCVKHERLTFVCTRTDCQLKLEEILKILPEFDDIYLVHSIYKQ